MADIRTSAADDHEDRRPRPPLLPPCRVCGGKASGFHYGVNTCEACKGFFRRSFTRAMEYRCSGNNDCSIQPRRRNNCAACRLKKCLEIGMSKHAIKTGRYSYEKKTQYIEEVKSRENKQVLPYDVSHKGIKTEGSFGVKLSVHNSGENPYFPEHYCSPDYDLGHEITYPETEAWKQKQEKTDAEKETHYEGKNVIYSRQSSEDGNIFDTGQACRSNKHSLTESSRHQCKCFDGHHIYDEENEKIIKDLLTSQDQLIEDLDAFLDEIHMKKRQKEFHQRVNRELPKSTVKSSIPKSELEIKRDEQMHKVAELMDSEFRNTISFIKAIPGWKKLDMKDQINLIKEGAAELWILGHCQCIDTELGVFTGEYDMTYQDAANIWTDVYVESVYKTSLKFSRLKLTKEELVVLKTIVLTFPDRCQMVDRESVESVQMQMLRCLQYVCTKNRVSFNRRFAEIMDGLTFARDMTEKFKEIVKTVVCQWVIFEKFPLLKEFFNSF